MIGITIHTPEYKALAVEACRRWKLHTRLKVRRIERKRDGFHWKLRLDELHDGPCCFFDADWWLLRPWKPEPSGLVWQAVHDPMAFCDYAFCGKDCERFSIDRHNYWNSGLFICDLSYQEHRDVFKRARESYEENKASTVVKVHDVTDQFHLNLATKELHTPFSFLPTPVNYYHFATVHGALPATPREIVGLHGAGIPLKDKARKMRAQASVFGEEVRPMLPRAVDFHFSMTFNLR